MNLKYTKENLKPLCENEASIKAVIEKIGLKSFSNKRLRDLIKEILVENCSYKGQAYKSGKNQVIKSNEEYFDINPNLKRNSCAVRDALFIRNVKDKQCEKCGLKTWLGKLIPLEVHHVNGIKYDNRLDNLKILCPNCHCFTDTYKVKNIKLP